MVLELAGGHVHACEPALEGAGLFFFAGAVDLSC